MRARALCLVACLVACFGACRPGTEMVVVVSATDLRIPNDIDEVRLLITNTMISSPDLPLCTDGHASCVTLPMVATLIPGPSRPDDPVTVLVTASRGGQPVLRDAATFVFRPGQRERLDFVLSRACLGSLACPDSATPESCDTNGQCAPLVATPLDGDPALDGGDGEPPDFAPGDGMPPDLRPSDFSEPSDLHMADLHAAPDLRVLPDLARPVDASVPPDLARFPDLAVAPDLSTPDMAAPGSFTTNVCVSAASIPAFSHFAASTCASYCASLNKNCTDTCTTNRGGANWGVEAWSDGLDCEAYAMSAGQGFCATDLSTFSEPNVAKYRCCCN